VDVRINHFRMICAVRCSNPRRLEYFVFGLTLGMGQSTRPADILDEEGPILLSLLSFRIS
jgi:hypothetical protein